MESIELDLRGKPCPIPVIEVKKRLASASPGDVVAAVVDNDIARQNLQKLAEDLGHGFSREQTADGNIRAVLTLCDACAEDANEDDGSGLVVAVGSDRMGDGGDELGRLLMKSFIFTLTDLEVPPESVLFFNSGIHLACEGSTVLDDLSTLMAKGARVHSCGTCLDYYKKKDALRAGGVTSMYGIVEALSKAKRTINL